MKLIVGLGNPGDKYIDSRHNIGFLVLKALAKAHNAVFKRDSGTFSLSTKVKIGSQLVLLAMPFTFMNLSGASIKALAKKYKASAGSLLVVCDDLDLELARLKVRAGGSSGGHNGLKSIIESLGTQSFARLRVGIGRPHRFMDSAEYVLSPFEKKEKEQVRLMIEKSALCCQAWATQGISQTMNIFNTRSSTYSV